MNQKLVILGGGESGVGAALLAEQKGYDVFLTDGSSLKEIYRNELLNAGIEFEEGRHTDEKILNADEVVKSPGIPEKNEMVKTTTTALTYHICKTAGVDCAMVGNIGFSFARQVATDPKPLYVAEISSFQLDDIKTFKPDIAILTNITEDHLD